MHCYWDLFSNYNNSFSATYCLISRTAEWSQGLVKKRLVNEWKDLDKRIFCNCLRTIGSSCYDPLVDVNERFGGFKGLWHSIMSKPHALKLPISFAYVLHVSCLRGKQKSRDGFYGLCLSHLGHSPKMADTEKTK